VEAEVLRGAELTDEKGRVCVSQLSRVGSKELLQLQEDLKMGGDRAWGVSRWQWFLLEGWVLQVEKISGRESLYGFERGDSRRGLAVGLLEGRRGGRPRAERQGSLAWEGGAGHEYYEEGGGKQSGGESPIKKKKRLNVGQSRQQGQNKILNKRDGDERKGLKLCGGERQKDRRQFERNKPADGKKKGTVEKEAFRRRAFNRQCPKNHGNGVRKGQKTSMGPERTSWQRSPNRFTILEKKRPPAQEEKGCPVPGR